MFKIVLRSTAMLVTSLIVFPLGRAEAVEFSPPPFQVPDGFTIEVVAAPPLVKYPMMACFDERGRLFVAETQGKNLDKQALLEQRCRFIRMLEDTNQDGKFDKSTLFADQLVMPEGAVWYRGSLYVLSSPYLWRFEDTDDDGVADVREKLLGYMDFTGQANQHGAYLGPNGRIYFSGGHLGYDLTSKDGKAVVKGRAAAVFSCRTDGTDVEVFGNGGINPVEVAFTAEGELFTTCPIFDSIGGRHDALIHWVHGSTAGPKDYAPPVLKQTGYRLPAVRRWGQVAPSGLMRYRSQTFGPNYQNSFFATHFNTATVVNVKLTRAGSTFQGTDQNFITSTSRDFHPTDVIEDADGSLLMIDTGGWFLISCPFSKIAKPEIMGAIYRIKRQAANLPADPRGLQIDWKASSNQLLTYLQDPRPVVRDRAIEALATRDQEAIHHLHTAWKELSTQQRRNAVWSLSRMESKTATAQIRLALSDPDHSVAQAAARSVGVLRDKQSVAALCQLLNGESWPLRRSAATALGRIGDASAIPHLLAAIALPGDDHLRHALVYALIEIKDAKAISTGLTHKDPRVQRAALLAMDQINTDTLSREQVTPLLGSRDERLRAAAINIITARPDWSTEIIQLLMDWSDEEAEPDLDREMAMIAVSAFQTDPQVQEIARRILNATPTHPAKRQTILQAIGNIRKLPKIWLPPLQKLLSMEADQIPLEVIDALRRSHSNQLNDKLEQIGDNFARSNKLRIAALSCLAESGRTLSEPGFQLLLSETAPERLPLDRLSATRSIYRTKLTEAQLQQLIQRLPHLSNNELGILTKKIDQTIEQQPEWQGQWARTRERLSSKLASTTSTDEQIQQRLKTLLTSLVAGDATHGKAIFYSSRAACSVCHAVNGKGGDTGPNLSRIGRIRRRVDLLEAILYPNSSIVNSFETYAVVTTTGRIEQGVIQQADARKIILRNAQRQDISIPREAVEEISRTGHSIMPQGLEKNLNKDELSDLLAYLESLGDQPVSKIEP
ncbi:MAG: c-type cytochrome [Planctomycetaceae bacterium]|nr:c-type cytochrome [Planctomycetaceae bacterium]